MLGSDQALKLGVDDVYSKSLEIVYFFVTNIFFNFNLIDLFKMFVEVGEYAALVLEKRYTLNGRRMYHNFLGT